MDQLVTSLQNMLELLPAPAIYILVAFWVGLESGGIGVPIEPVMLFAGSLAAQPRHPIVTIIAIPVTVLGCLVFVILSYEIGKHIGTKAISGLGRFIGLTEVRVEHIEFSLRRRGFTGILLARITPIVRSFSSYVMGAADLPLPVLVIGTVIGSTIYCGFWIMLGSLLGEEYTRALDAFGQYQPYVIGVAVVVILAYLVIHRHWGRSAMRDMAIAWERNAAQATERVVAAGRAAGHVAERVKSKVVSRPPRPGETAAITGAMPGAAPYDVTDDMTRTAEPSEPTDAPDE